MSVLVNYARYRKLRLRNAAILAGLDQVVIPTLKGALGAVLAILAYGVVTHTVEASQRDADNRVAIQLYKQAAYIKSLESIVDKCTSPGENVITVDDVYYLCGATSTGIKVRP